jgi:hypothetical protein
MAWPKVSGVTPEPCEARPRPARLSVARGRSSDKQVYQFDADVIVQEIRELRRGLPAQQNALISKGLFSPLNRHMINHHPTARLLPSHLDIIGSAGAAPSPGPLLTIRSVWTSKTPEH